MRRPPPAVVVICLLTVSWRARALPGAGAPGELALPKADRFERGLVLGFGAHCSPAASPLEAQGEVPLREIGASYEAILRGKSFEAFVLAREAAPRSGAMAWNRSECPPQLLLKLQEVGVPPALAKALGVSAEPASKTP